MNTEFYFLRCYEISELITKRYSTSFSLATSLMEPEVRKAVYAVYGFVRLADEVVDSFHGYPQQLLLDNLEQQLEEALQQKISTNPILNAFVDTVERHQISREYIAAFMRSMRADLSQATYTSEDDLNEYIYGSADVVGLICLQIFCRGNEPLFLYLSPAAEKLGSAFQKVNFLRDLHCDKEKLGRSYFPEVSNDNFNKESKQKIEASIEADFAEALVGIKALPGRSKMAVALAYYYYKVLFNKIKRSSPERLLKERVRISNVTKCLLLLKIKLLYTLNKI